MTSLPDTPIHGEILISARASTDPDISICSVRTYLAAEVGAMIMWCDTAVREKNAQAWDKLSAAWKATFHTQNYRWCFGETAYRRTTRLLRGTIYLAGRNSPLPQGTRKGTVASTSMRTPPSGVPCAYISRQTCFKEFHKSLS